MISLSDKTNQELNQIEQHAKEEENNAIQAETVVSNAISHSTPQRQYSEDKSQNKR